MENNKSFELIDKISFVRTAGSLEEAKCIDIIKTEVKKIGLDCEVEEFDIDGFEIKEASLTTSNPELKIESVGVGMSGSTSEEGVCGPLVYINSLESVPYYNLEGAIVLIHSKMVAVKLYEELVKQKVAGIIVSTGSVYKDHDDVDLDPYQLRDKHLKFGKIPSVCIRMKDAEELLKANPEKVTIKVIQEECVKKAHNIIATIEGSTRPDEIIAFTAHYDSVSFSKGAYDNASGSACIFESLAHFMKNKPERTIKVIWCGAEEMGLLGSLAYVKAHKEELEKIKLCINVDMVGVTLGSDIACCTANDGLVEYIKYLSKEVGFPIKAYEGVYSSDSTPFADAGIPSLSFARLAPKGGSEIHSHDDVTNFLEPNNYYKTCEFINYFAGRLINAKVFPVERIIKEELKGKINQYFNRPLKK